MEKGVYRFYDGDRHWNCRLVEELSGDGYEYQFTANIDEWDEREFKIYRRIKDGELFAVPRGITNG